MATMYRFMKEGRKWDYLAGCLERKIMVREINFRPKIIYNSYHILSYIIKTGGLKKMPSAYSIPQIYEQEIEAVVDAGYYSNKSEVVRDALRMLFEAKVQLRLAAAVELYKREKVTLSRGAEIAGLSFPEFKDILIDRGVEIKTPGGSKEELEAGIERLKKSRKAK